MSGSAHVYKTYSYYSSSWYLLLVWQENYRQCFKYKACVSLSQIADADCEVILPDNINGGNINDNMKGIKAHFLLLILVKKVEKHTD